MAAAEGTVFGTGQLLDQAGKSVSGFGPTLVGNPTEDAKLNTSTYVEGGPPKRPDQLGLDKGTAERIKAKLGDRLSLIAPNGRAELTVSGIFTFGSSNSLAGATLVEVQTAHAQQLFNRVGLYDEINIRGQDGLTQDQLRDRVTTVIPATAKGIDKFGLPVGQLIAGLIFDRRGRRPRCPLPGRQGGEDGRAASNHGGVAATAVSAISSR